MNGTQCVLAASGMKGWFKWVAGWRCAGGRGNGNARKGFLGFLQRRSGSLVEVGARWATVG